jgi:selenocysteine-specific elongation factor
MKSGIKTLLSKRKTITVAEVRDQFNTTRKYALAMMEHLDSIGVTVREGDSRRLVEV